MARFKVTPFANYQTSRLGVKVVGKEFKFLPTLATVSKRPASSTCELCGFVTYSIAREICRKSSIDAVRVEVTDWNPETAEFRLKLVRDKGDGYVAWLIGQMAKTVADWLEENGKEVELTTPIITRKTK